MTLPARHYRAVLGLYADGGRTTPNALSAKSAACSQASSRLSRASLSLPRGGHAPGKRREESRLGSAYGADRQDDVS